MKQFRQIQKTFVRQLGRNDCGVACLCMILKFAGREAQATRLRTQSCLYDYSLLDLRHLAQSAGLNARCVRMDLEFLAVNRIPCILHLDGDAGHHFQVCYGRKKQRDMNIYLMGDPARGVHLMTERSLDMAWKSRAALYFDDLSATPAAQAKTNWLMLFSGDLIPKGLLVCIPLLSIFTAVLGVAWSWALQRGINNSIAEKQDHLIWCIVVLLFLVTMARNLFSNIRQRLMIRLNTAVNRHLMFSLIRRVISQKGQTSGLENQDHFKNGVQRMMKIQQAVSAFLVTVLSEGAILILVMAALLYQSPIAGLINLVYLGIITCYSLRKFPQMLFEHAHLNELSGLTEKIIVQNPPDPSGAGLPGEPALAFEFHSENHSRYLDFAGKVSLDISRTSLAQECMGTINVICVFVYGILKLRDWSLSYGSFMILVILSYFITALMPKICSSLFVVHEGMEASRQCPVDPVI